MCSSIICTASRWVFAEGQRDSENVNVVKAGHGLAGTTAQHLGQHSATRAPHTEDHTLSAPCCDARYGCVPTACLSSPGDGSCLATRTCSKTWTFLGRLHVWAHRTHHLRPSPRSNNWQPLPLRNGCPRVRF